MFFFFALHDAIIYFCSIPYVIQAVKFLSISPKVNKNCDKIIENFLWKKSKSNSQKKNKTSNRKSYKVEKKKQKV